MPDMATLSPGEVYDLAARIARVVAEYPDHAPAEVIDEMLALIVSEENLNYTETEMVRSEAWDLVNGSHD